MATNLKRIFFGSLLILSIFLFFLLKIEKYLFYSLSILVLYEVYISGIIKSKIIIHIAIILISILLFLSFEFNIILLILLSITLIILSFFFQSLIKPSFTFFLSLFFFCISKIYIIDIYLIYLIIFISFLNDSVAYIAGRSIKGPLIIPSISPNKTWSGTIFSFLVSSSLLIYFDYSIFISFLMASSLFFGDIYFSFIKRKNNIKDFSNFIPGHGGILDRIDSMVFFTFILITINSL